MSAVPTPSAAAEGGHDAIHPQLGTLDDFRALVAAAKDNGLEIALDFAIQCSPDHPWLREHPDWFRWRPDGSLRYAENPPKKYEDIVNPGFLRRCGDAGAVVRAARRDAVLGAIRACASSGSTIRTPSRCRSGTG